MSSSLKQDICGLDAPGVLVGEVDSSRVETCLPPEVQYACLYWIEHLQKSGGQLHDNDQVHQFLQTHFLHWLEALSWMRKMSEGILANRSLDSIALVSLLPTRLEHGANPSPRFVTVLNCQHLSRARSPCLSPGLRLRLWRQRSHWKPPATAGARQQPSLVSGGDPDRV